MMAATSKFVGTITQVQEAKVGSRHVVALAVSSASETRLRFVWHSPIRESVIERGSNVWIEYLPVSVYVPDARLKVTLPKSDQVPRRCDGTVVDYEQLRSGLPGAAEIGLDRDLITIDFTTSRETCLFDKTSTDVPRMGSLAEIEVDLVGFSC